MADHVSYSDDISSLWGSQGEDVLSPAPSPGHDGPLNGGDAHANGRALANGNGSHLTVVEDETHADVARLAEAIAANHAEVVHRHDLEAVRAELEGAFTHQLAVALYELMAASNARFATAEDHINQRVAEAMEVHTTRLVEALEGQRSATSQVSERIWSELGALRRRLTLPIDGLAGFQRELRHEVGRLSDLLSRHGGDGAADAEPVSGGNAGDVTQTLAAVREEVSALREELAELRAAVEDGRPRGRRSRRWSRAG